jgi:hypothetical protein
VLAIPLMLAWLGSADARAGLVISVPDVVVQQGDSGAFDVLITNEGGAGDPSFDLSAFTLSLVLEGGPGVVFDVAPTIATDAPYVFVDSAVAQGLADFSLDVFPTTSFLAADAEFDASLARTIAPGQSFGLARVFFRTSEEAWGTWRVRIGDDTSLADVDGGAIAFSTRHGVLEVVPEPASLVSLSVCAVGLGLVRARLRSARRRSAG